MGASPGIRIPERVCLDDDALMDQEGQHDMNMPAAQGYEFMQGMYLPKSYSSWGKELDGNGIDWKN
jgi:hypothetical protein